MGSARHRRLLPLAVPVASIALLAVLGTLQYRWIGEVSRAERQRLEAGLQRAAGRLAEDFDREITRAFVTFLPSWPPGAAPLEDRLIEAHAAWRASAPYPELLEALYLVRDGDATGLARFDPFTESFEGVPWPEALEPLRHRLGAGRVGRWRLRRPGRVPGWPAVAEPPALVVPQPEGGAASAAILLLDEAFLFNSFLAELTERHFAVEDGLEKVVWIVHAEDPQRVLYRQGAESGGSVPGGEVTVGLFRLRATPELRNRSLARLFGGPRRGAEASPRDGPRRRTPGLPPEGPAWGQGAWRLVVSPAAGSLEAAVARLRRRNLAIGFGVLLLLGVGGAVLVSVSHRAERLARQQLEFVSGVTHELHTPLTAIRSAGENLADGTVSEPAQVRRYGRLVQEEGRRLSEMVAQVLEYAGIASGRRSPTRERVSLAAVVDEAIDDCRGLLEGGDVALERRLAETLPPLVGDAGALRRAVRNLLENALKHAREGGWVRIAAEADLGAGEVVVSVEDRGPGVRRQEIAQIFEPFARGRQAKSGGSGLGLAVVRQIAEAHGGRATAAPRPDGGAVFSLHLPAAPLGAGTPVAEPEASEAPG